jgi:heme A synthase
MVSADRNESQEERRGRIALILAGAAFAVFAANVIAGKASLLLGVSSPLHVGNVAEFLLLVFAIICFVVAILERERARANGSN